MDDVSKNTYPKNEENIDAATEEETVAVQTPVVTTKVVVEDSASTEELNMALALQEVLHDVEDMPLFDELSILEMLNQSVAEELLSENSNYVSSKPSTLEGGLLGSSMSENHILDVSAMAESFPEMRSSEALTQLGSTLSAGIATSQGMGSLDEYYFSSLLGSLQSTLATNHVFEETTYAVFEKAEGWSTVAASSISYSAAPAIVYFKVFGSDGSGTVTGTAGADALYGSSESAPAPYSLVSSIYNPTPVAGDFFGQNVVVSGNNLIVGASGDDTNRLDSGSVYVYDITTGALTYTINNPFPSPYERFGSSVAADGNFLVIGANQERVSDVSATGAAYVYDLSTGAYVRTIHNPTPEISDNFGTSVAISGNIAIFGVGNDNTGADNVGAAYIFDISTGALLHTLDNPSPVIYDRFGSGVAINSNYAVVSAVDDDTGASNAGSIYIYDVVSGALLNTINSPNAFAFGDFGSSIHLDGDYLLVGAPGETADINEEGNVYIFDVTTGALVTQLESYIESGGFGHSVSISGNYAAIGVVSEALGGTNTGAVHIYDIATGQALHTIQGDWGSFSLGGSSVSIDGNNLAIGVYLESTVSGGAGAVFTYKIDFGDSDILYGGAGDDILYGLYGNDSLVGQAGSDVLYGGEGADRFIFEGATAFDGSDTLMDFNMVEGDVLDISDVLTGYTYWVSNMDDFVRFTDVGADTIMEIDANGSVGGANFQAVATIIGGAGTLDATDMETWGQLDAVP